MTRSDTRLRLGPALRARCPRCGAKDVWARWGQLAERCPGCGLVFLREHGYWTGGLIVNIAIAQLVLMALLVGTVALTYPDVPWTPLGVAAVGAMIALPIWCYPRTKTVWLYVDLLVHPYSAEERGSDPSG